MSYRPSFDFCLLRSRSADSFEGAAFVQLLIAISKAPLVEFNELRNNNFREIEF